MEENSKTNPQLKLIDRIIAAYKAKKLRLQAVDVQSNIKEEEGVRTRMVKGYNKNRDKIESKPKEDIPQAEKRRRKLADLLSRSSSWRGIE